MDEIIYKQFQQHLKQGDKESARQLITLYVKENPDDAEAWYLVAGVAVNKTQRIALLNKVLQIDPLHTKASHALEKLQAQSATAITPTAKSPSSNYRNLIIVGLGGILILALASVVFLMLQDKNTTDAVIDLPTRVSVVLETETSTPTDTPLPTDTPSATNTPRPTRTPAPTNTPRPTRTPRPTNTPQLGTRTNPFPYDDADEISIGVFDEEIIAVGGIIRGLDTFISEANMFNPEPRRGEEWILVNLTILCRKDINEICRYSQLLHFHLIDRNGQIYEPQLIAGLDELMFPYEIYGDAVGHGNIGFIIPSSLLARDLLFVYAPLSSFSDERYFFELRALNF